MRGTHDLKQLRVIREARVALEEQAVRLRAGRAVTPAFDGREELMCSVRGRKECTAIPQEEQAPVADRQTASWLHDKVHKLQMKLKRSNTKLDKEHKAGRELADLFAVSCISHLGVQQNGANRSCDTDRNYKLTRAALQAILPERHLQFFKDWKGKGCFGGKGRCGHA